MESQGETDKAAVIVKDLYARYPNDSVVKYYYGKLLRRSKAYSEALDIFKTLDEERIMVKVEQIRCMLELESWYQVIELCKSCYEQLDLSQESVAKFLDRAWIYAHKKIGVIPKMNREFTYVEKQILCYSLEEAKDYNRRSHPFEKEERLEELFDNLVSVLPNGKFIPNTTTLTDSYLFSYITSNHNVDVLEAVTIHNTTDLILMYPVRRLKKNWNAMIQDDLLLLDMQNEENRPTQVEKFKQKYKKFL